MRCCDERGIARIESALSSAWPSNKKLLRVARIAVFSAVVVCCEASHGQLTDDRLSVLRFLEGSSLSQPSRSILVGQLAAQLNGADNYERFAAVLGDAPAIFHWEARWDYGNIGFEEYVRRSICAADKGAIVAIGWVDKNPPVPGRTLADCDKTNPARDRKACAIFWDDWVAVLAQHLAVLNDKQITVLLRPLHEPENRQWIANGKASYRKVWQQLYQHLVYEKKLTNLLFVLGLDSTRDPDYLPEAEYVNVVGTSEYVDPPYTEDHFAHLQWLRRLRLYENKPFAICEAGSLKNSGKRSRALDYLDAVEKHAPFVSYISWWHESSLNNYQWALYQAHQAQAFIDDERILTRSELPWKKTAARITGGND